MRIAKTELVAEILALVLPKTGHDPGLDDYPVYKGSKFYGYRMRSDVLCPGIPRLTMHVKAKGIRHGYHYRYEGNRKKFFIREAWKPTSVNLPKTPEVEAILRRYSEIGVKYQGTPEEILQQVLAD